MNTIQNIQEMGLKLLLALALAGLFASTALAGSGTCTVGPSNPPITGGSIDTPG